MSRGRHAVVHVLGLDPGLANTGFALLTGERLSAPPELRDLGVYTSDKDASLRDRVTELCRDLSPLMGVNVVVVESPNFPRGSKAAAMVWAAFALIHGLCAGRALLVVRTPGEWRRMLGLPARPEREAGERKDDTRKLMQRRFPQAAAFLVELQADKHEHATDALAIACSYWDCGAESAATYRRDTQDQQAR